MDIKVAVIGCGAWGKNIVRNFYEIGHLHAISDLNQQTAIDISTLYNVHNYTIHNILSDFSINAVAVVTPAETHYKIVKQVLESGKNVFVEKPLTMDTNQAVELVRLAESKNLTIMTGHLLQYHPAYISLKQMVVDKKLGNLRYIYSNRLSLGRIRSEENCIWDLAPHDFSMILGLTDAEPLTVETQDIPSQEPGILDTVTTFLTFPSGVKAQVFVSWVHPFKEQKLVVIGDKGMAVFDDCLPWENKLTFYPHHIKWGAGDHDANVVTAITQMIDISPAEPLKNECQHFIDSIRNSSAPVSGGYESLRVVRTLQRAHDYIDNKITNSRLKGIA